MKKVRTEVTKIRNWNAGEDVEKLLGPIIKRHLNLLLTELKNEADVYVTKRGGRFELVLLLGEEGNLAIRVPFKQIDALKKQYEKEEVR